MLFFVGHSKVDFHTPSRPPAGGDDEGDLCDASTSYLTPAYDPSKAWRWCEGRPAAAAVVVAPGQAAARPAVLIQCSPARPPARCPPKPFVLAQWPSGCQDTDPSTPPGCDPTDGKVGGQGLSLHECGGSGAARLRVPTPTLNPCVHRRPPRLTSPRRQTTGGCSGAPAGTGAGWRDPSFCQGQMHGRPGRHLTRHCCSPPHARRYVMVVGDWSGVSTSYTLSVW